MYGILHVVTQKEFIKSTIKVLDDYLKLAREQAKQHGQIANQLTVIFDMDGFNLKQYMWKPAGELVLILIQMYEANYPEILKMCFIINGKFNQINSNKYTYRIYKTNFIFRDIS
ncbi:Retinal-binding protein [Harpegnathos saltator]|uniref:Retinal-binding protein n=1 Tax=Harpegnathos saltator TaxID=610380 RepID=E2BZS9_HARSA|nr:Retinal-binding protein [Harpegnathos saltator]